MLRDHSHCPRWLFITAAVLVLGAVYPSARGASMPQAKSTAQPSSDPRNFEGVWQPDFAPPLVQAGKGTNGALATVEGTIPPFTAKGAKIFWHRVKMEQAGTPVASSVSRYLPALPVYQLDLFLGMMDIIQDRNNVVILFEDGSQWQIHLDRGHPKNLTPTYKGDSVGRFEGATLVADSIGFNAKTWLDAVGSPHGTNLHLTTRIRKIQNGQKLEFLTTYTDPEMYSKPFTVRRTASFQPDGYLLESEIDNLRPENNANLIYEDN